MFANASSMQCVVSQEVLAKATVLEEAGLLCYGCFNGWFRSWLVSYVRHSPVAFECIFDAFAFEHREVVSSYVLAHRLIS